MKEKGISVQITTDELCREKGLQKVDSITIRYVFTEDLAGVNSKSRCDPLMLKRKG